MPRGLAIGRGIAMGLEKAATNIYNIGIQRQKMEREKELFGLQKKKAELDIQHMELTDMDPEVIESTKQGLKYDSLSKKANFEKAEFSLKSAYREEKKKGMALKAEAQANVRANELYEQFRAGALSENVDFSMDIGPAKIGTRKRAPSKWEMLFGGADTEVAPQQAAPQKAAPSAAGDKNIAGTIKSLQDQGIGNDEIRSLMTDQGLDPAEYDL